MRVACYARVSSEEQARGGISIDAQLDALRTWAKDNGHEIVGEYVDPGISARKAPVKRPALQRLLADLAGVELVAFTKLDRWTRNVKGYYQVQDVLDKSKVAWIAIHEDYETVTASGRFKVNIMLSVAENEADRTGERIKTVQQYKIALGEPISGNMPIGYQVIDKRAVPDRYAQAVVDAFELYARTGNKCGVQRMLRERYGLTRALKNVDGLLRNRMYIGSFGGNDAFCEPLVSRSLYDKVQRTLAGRTSKQSPTGEVYLFSGLAFCSECGRRLGGAKNGAYIYYRCPDHHNRHVCDNPSYYRQGVIEAACLAQLADLVKNKTAAAPVKAPPPVNVPAVKQKLARLKELYVEGDIDKAQYLSRKNELTALLEASPSVRPSIVLGNNFAEEYGNMPAEKKKQFWRSVLDRVVCYPNKDLDIFFSAELY